MFGTVSVEECKLDSWKGHLSMESLLLVLVSVLAILPGRNQSMCRLQMSSPTVTQYEIGPVCSIMTPRNHFGSPLRFVTQTVPAISKLRSLLWAS